MNSRYRELQDKVKELYAQGGDRNLMQGLFNLVTPSHHPKVDYTQDLKNGTKYSNLNASSFMELFSKENFVNHSNENLTHIFQELHNRYVTGKGYEVTRNVVVGNDLINFAALGYVNSQDNMLFINKTAIEKAQKTKAGSMMNQDNLGLIMNYVITHESQHICQFESAVDFVLGKNQDKATKFLGAFTAIEQTNLNTAVSKFDLFFINKWKKNYDHHYIEHNANYSAFKSVNENLSEEQKKTKEYDDYAKYTGILALRGYPLLGREKFVDKRIKKIERFLKYELKYFNFRVKDCPLKRELMNTVNEYMQVDKNGNSQFRDDLKNQMNEIIDSVNDAVVKGKGKVNGYKLQYKGILDEANKTMF